MMNTKKNKFTAILSATLFLTAAFVCFTPAIALAQTILKPGEIIYGRGITNPTGGGTCNTAARFGRSGRTARTTGCCLRNALHPRISPDGRFILFQRFSASTACIVGNGARPMVEAGIGNREWKRRFRIISPTPTAIFFRLKPTVPTGRLIS